MSKEKYSIGVFAGFYTPSRETTQGTVFQTCWVKLDSSLIKVNIFGETILNSLRIGTKLKLSITKPKSGMWENCEFINAELLYPSPHRELEPMNFTVAGGFQLRYGLSK